MVHTMFPCSVCYQFISKMLKRDMILSYAKCNTKSRWFCEGEGLINAQHIILCGVLGGENIVGGVSNIYGFLLQTSAINEIRHTVRGTISLDVNRIFLLTCSCKADNSESCKHIVTTSTEFSTKFVPSRTEQKSEDMTEHKKLSESRDNKNIISCHLDTDPQDRSSGPSTPSSKRSIILGELEDELERQLEEKANRNELSAKNVKSLLRAVLIHEDVRKYVEFALKRTDEQPEYQWKLTRAKAKELIDKLPDIAPFLCLPIPQKRSDIDALINEELPEDSSDEEYQPLDETVDDDEDSICQHVEDDSSIMSPPPCPSSQENSASVSPVNECSKAENIGQRTRSKFSLSQTPLEAIEQAFIPPDITEDMYNTECDNQDWLNFLKDLVKPLDNSADNVETNDDENDPEYNIMVDEELEDLDNEELRIDRAVKISRKEVEDLMTELFEYTQMHEDGLYSDDENCAVETGEDVDSLITQPVNLSLSEAPENCSENFSPATSDSVAGDVACTTNEPDPNDQVITDNQRLLLLQQLMQHTQLLLQCYLLSCGNPFVDVITRNSFKSKLLELESLQKAAPFPHSIFAFPTLQSSLELMSKYDAFVESNKAALYKWNRDMASSPAYKKTIQEGSPGIHPHLMTLCLRSDAFQYPLLLPKVGFRSSSLPIRNRFSEAEDRLISFGLEDCENNLGIKLKSSSGLLQACDLIRRTLVPVKSAESIMKHVLNKKSLKLPNIIKNYFLFRKAAGVDHFVVPISFNKLLPLYQLDTRLINSRWHSILYSERENRRMLLPGNARS